MTMSSLGFCPRSYARHKSLVEYTCGIYSVETHTALRTVKACVSIGFLRPAHTAAALRHLNRSARQASNISACRPRPHAP